jgi:lysophospholipase L1-like esterase
MKVRNIFFVCYVVLVAAAGLLLTEVVSQKVNSANGIYIPLAIALRPYQGAWSVLDPHLGYAHAETEALVKKLQEKYSWIDGFVVYSKRAPADLERPIILAMGGSTTDGVRSEHSWPEELSKLLAQRGISGTVVNGGTVGYSTNQELLKLVRDGLEFKPDIIISYSGVNDIERYVKLPYPMVHPYQRYTLEFLTRPPYSPLFPNTIYLLNQILWGSQPARMTATLGVRSSETLGQQYERNMALMAAIARAGGAKFYGIIQPNAYVSPGGHSRDPEKEGAKEGIPAEYVAGPAYIAGVKDLYEQISDIPTRLPFVHSFISIFDGEDGTYVRDGFHATLKGDHVIAEKVLDLIYADLSVRKTRSLEQPVSAKER